LQTVATMADWKVELWGKKMVDEKAGNWDCLLVDG
jgi:hypothetical protein